MGVEMVQTVEEFQGGTRQALRELHMRARREGWSPVDLSKQEAAKDIPPEAMRKMTVYEDKENVHLFSFTETESGTVHVHHQRVRKPTAGPGGGPPPLATEAGESHGSLARMVVGQTVMSIDRESDGVVTLVSRSSLSREQTRAAAAKRLTEWGWHQQSLTPGALPGDGDPFAGNRWQRNGDSCLLVYQDAENGGTTCMYRFSLAQ
jgi:hypothetical protein